MPHSGNFTRGKDTQYPYLQEGLWTSWPVWRVLINIFT